MLQRQIRAAGLSTAGATFSRFVFAVPLAALTENPGDLVTRDQLRARLWPRGEHLDYDHALTTAVKKLRGALNDSPTQPRYIETLPKRGYRFIAPVETVAAGPTPAAAQEEPA